MSTPIHFRAMTEVDKVLFSKLIPYRPGWDFKGIAAYTQGKRGELVMGMIGFDSWTPRTVMCHFAGEHPRCSLPLWQEAVHYIESTGRKAMLGMLRSDNTRALGFLRRIGWQELYHIEDGWRDGVDIVILEYRIHGYEHAAAATKRLLSSNGRDDVERPRANGHG